MSEWTDKRDAFWAHVESFFTTLKGRVTALLEAGVESVTTAISTAAPAFEGDIVAFLKQTALDCVVAAETTGGDGQAKMAAALATFLTDVTAKGIPLAQNDARIILENAVAAFKASQAKAA